MKKLFTFILTLMATNVLWAHDFYVGGIYYTILIDKPNEVEVTYRGADYNSFPNEYSGYVIVPATVTFSGTTYNVTSIGENAFTYCSSLTRTTIENGVKNIENSAFYSCSSLTEVTIPNSVTSIGENAFAYCSSLTSVAIPNSVTTIGQGAFGWCSSLTSITIPNSVTSIGNNAFYECFSLASPVYNAHCFAYLPSSYQGTYTIANGIKMIAGGAFWECSGLTEVTIPNSVTSIGGYAFHNCSSLKEVTMGNGVKSIEYSAFNKCSSLTSITIPESVTSMGNGVFEYCTSLTSISIPDSVKSIGNWTFSRCSSLMEATIGNSVSRIGEKAFEYCSSLTSITIPESVTSIDEYAFSHCSSLKSITIPNNVTNIGNSAFSHCSSLTEVTISDSVASIGDWVFNECTSLTSPVYNAHFFVYLPTSYQGAYTIPNGIKQITGYALWKCNGLTSIIIPTSVTSAGNGVLGFCSSLTFIKSLAEVPPTLGDFAFYELPTSIPLYVPCESLADYQAAGWNYFTNTNCISSDEVPADSIIINAGCTDVTIIWPTDPDAETYTIVIKKDDEVFCTLSFNADGQLLNIAFAPGRDGCHPVQYAEQANNGYRFVVTGLEEGTNYTYTITSKDAANKTISEHSGTFATKFTTDLENTHGPSPRTNTHKIFRDGQLIIIHDAKIYNAMGLEVK